MSCPLSTLVPLSQVEGRRIGLMGGSFNPPHAGHLHVAREALRRLVLDEVWWLPALHNPLKPEDIYADYELRLQATKELARHPHFRVLDIERCLQVHYTIDLLEALSPLLSRGYCAWVMGADSFATFHRWRRWRNIAAMIPLAVFDRPSATLQALCSPAAVALRHHRLPAHLSRLLPEMSPPAWAFFSIRRHPESSTRLRAMGLGLQAR